jgi:hypothetical protein
MNFKRELGHLLKESGLPNETLGKLIVQVCTERKLVLPKQKLPKQSNNPIDTNN